MAITPAQPFNAFLQGRQARQDEEYGNTRNALAQQELANAPAQMQRRNKLADLQISQLESAQGAAGQERKQAAYAQIGGLAKQALQSGNPREFVAAALSNPAYASVFQQAGIDPRQIDLNSQSFDHDLQAWASIAGGVPQKLETLEGDGGSILQRDPTTGALKQVVAPQKPDHFAAGQAAADRRAAESRAHAERMAADQRGFTGGQNDLNRQSAMDLKNRSAEVKQKVLEQQNKRAYDVYQTAITGLTGGLKGATTGPIVGRMPAWTAGQQIADGTVAAMAPVLKALFRGSGEGTFTDKDQDLLMEMLPTRKDEKEARASKLSNIDAIVKAKLGIAASPAPQGGAPAAGAVEDGYRFKGGDPADPNSWEQM